MTARTPSERLEIGSERTCRSAPLSFFCWRTLTCAAAFLSFALLAPGAASADPAGPVARLVERGGRAQLEARLVRSHQEPHRVGVLFDLGEGWHIYWRSSGDTGLPPELSWQVDGASVEPVSWPLPEAFDGGGSEEGAPSYGYEHRVLLASALRGEAASGAFAGDLAVDGEVLVCEYECVPASFRLERRAGEPLGGMTPEAEDALFESFAKRVPTRPEAHGLELSAAWSQSAIRPGDSFQGAIAVRSCTRDEHCNIHAPDRTSDPAGVFFIDDRETVRIQVQNVYRDPSDPRLHWIELRGTADAGESIDFDRLTGVLALHDEAGRERPVEVDLPFPRSEAGAQVTQLGAHWPSEPAGSPSALALLRALALALLGGLVLNLMPCVLPVLAIKVFSLSEMASAAHADPREPLRHGTAYTAGILASMAALGGCVIALRAAGRSVGWGFQFQEPIYVAGISAVLVAFALNLFGAYEIRGGAGRLATLGQEATGARRSFFEGLLAVALATPCSAPFLGTAVGFAFASSSAVVLGIFLAIGFGLALPFLLVSLAPSWARFMPRSGAWMQVVRAGLGFALLATVLWLLWIFGGRAGAGGVVALLGFLLALSFGLWTFGQLQQGGHPRMVVAAGISLVALAVGGLNAVGARVEIESSADASRTSQPPADSPWKTWSAEAVDAHLAAERPVFVRFTADWCITCKVNERVALSDAAVSQAFERAGFALLVGDWTQRDDAIRQELARHGRAGVPLYLVYHPDRPNQPEMLPELLTPDRVLAAIDSVRDPQTASSAGPLKPPASIRR